jgi:DNA-binding phage protein
MSKKKTQDVAAELRRAIARSEKHGMTRYAIAKAAKMPRSQLTRVATGETLPRIDTAERIATAIGCRLVLTSVAK